MPKPKKSNSEGESAVPVTKQTAGGVTGAVVGGVIAGPIGAVIGGVAGAMMGNRAAQGKSFVPPGAVQTAKSAAKGVKAKVLRVKPLRQINAKAKKAIPAKLKSAGKTTTAKPHSMAKASKTKRTHSARSRR